MRFKHLTNYRLFRYEDLLADPEMVLKTLCKFIDADFTEDLLHPEKGRHEHQRSSLTGKQPKAFDADAATRWRTLISASDNWLITTLTKRSMERFDYDPEVHPIFRLSRHSLASGGERCEEPA